MIWNLNILIQNSFVDRSITKWWKRGKNKLFHKASTMCWTVGAGECTTHFYSREPRTSLTFICIKSECPAQARIGGGGCGGFKWRVHYRITPVNSMISERAGLAKRWEQAWHRDETRLGTGMRALANVARVQFPNPPSYVDWVGWFSILFWEVFPQGLRFFPLTKHQHLIWFGDSVWFVVPSISKAPVLG